MEFYIGRLQFRDINKLNVILVSLKFARRNTV
jgi:hypothetical protein